MVSVSMLTTSFESRQNVECDHRRVLIIGGSSLVGSHLIGHLGRDRVVFTYNRSPIPGGIAFDIRAMAMETLDRLATGCSHAVILAGNTNPDACARDPASARTLNVEAITALIDRLDRLGVVPVFTSTEAVFDGRRGRYTETDPVAPLMTYAAHKVEIETYLAARSRPYLTVRLARVVTDTPRDATLFSAWLRQIEAGKGIRCAEDHIFSPIHADDVAAALAAMMTGGHTGLFHLGGPDALSRLAMLERLVETWRAAGHRFDGTLVPCAMADFATQEPRPRDISLISGKMIAATGILPRSVDEICRALIRAWFDRKV